MLRRIALPVAVVLLSLALPAPASALFHEMKIVEVFPGTNVAPDRAFVELQMYSSGQRFVSGHHLRTYDNAGVELLDVMIPSDVAQGDSQRRILFGDIDVTNRDFDANLGVQPPRTGGAVCFENIDCVAWGNMTPMGIAALPAPVGTPSPAIPDGDSLVRNIGAGCATLLENADDTNNSAADFTLTADETPEPNSATPNETPCGGGGGGAPDTKIDKGPKKKTSSKKAKFTFSVIGAATGFECSLDNKAFKTCTSPQAYKKLKPGKHTFEVRAIGGGTPDPTPATYKWKIKKPKKK